MLSDKSRNPTPPNSNPGDDISHSNPVSPCKECEIILKLVTDDGYPIPYAAFRLECIDGLTKHGRLDKNGRQVVRGLPKNMPFAVYYPEEEDIRAKAFAARLDDGLSKVSPEMVLGVLMQPATDLRNIATKLDWHFSGPMVKRCISVFKGHDCLPLIENLLARAGLYDKLIVIDYDKGR